MKKLVIVLLAAMLVFSLTSCKDKSEEMIEIYEKFCSTVTLGDRVMKTFYDSVDFDDKDDTTKLNENDISAIIGLSSGSEAGVKSIGNKVGKVEKEQTKDGNKTTITWKTIVIDYTAEDGTTGQLTINGTYEYERVIAGRAVSSSVSCKYNFTINGTSYSADYTTESGKYSAASVDGKGVNLRILNAGM